MNKRERNRARSHFSTDSIQTSVSVLHFGTGTSDGGLILNLDEMDWIRVLGFIGLVIIVPASPSKVLSGQRICKLGTNKPCYKIGYFQENQRKLNFEEARRACQRDGGELLSIESSAEQNLIEGFIHELRASDGDFWIGLRREPSYEESSGDCTSQYYWLDGSRSTFRNWHWDEPSCGYEVCVVMYHQPSASSGPDGLYMFQWNDDNCETKNNFICKYTKDKAPVPPAERNRTRTGNLFKVLQSRPTAEVTKNKSVVVNGDVNSVSEHTDNALNIAYIILPTIPLLLLLIVAVGVFCFRLFSKRRKDTPAPPPHERFPWVSGERCSSPSPDVYNVIRRQHDADLSETRPQTKNTSFLGSSPDTPTGEYDNLGTRDTESGFVTLASTESGFVPNEIYEACQGRTGSRYYKEHGWLDNELYGY
ncbi:layilin [Trichomycterus rosablanca]|uniref:layilin n=1 Tax=Trichomycterus rosablanca TaxID=2290929 RepID=UPI002F351504